MILVIEGLFLNICIILALTFFYLQLKWRIIKDRIPENAMHWIDGLAGGVLGIMLIHFSIRVTEETIVDLRFVPILLLILFIGVRPALIGVILIIFGRFAYGVNSSSFSGMIFIVAMLIGFYMINKRMGKSNITKKVTYMILLSNIVFTILLSNLVRDVEVLKTIVPMYWVISSIGAYLSVIAIAYFKKSQDLFQTYKEQSEIDFLTGLNNVRQFDQLWNKSINIAVEKQESISLLLIDIDFFKRVNDTYGHAAGDEVLQQLGKILNLHTRSFDIVSRNGGEEFSVILKGCSHKITLKIAERIRKSIEDFSFEISNSKSPLNITVSIGVSTYPHADETPESMIESTDKLLYKAKRLGRNRVVSS
ncbi:diguanylate cyclase [Jeotgalibacillus sp. JSM ZJ347]|uniref:GGDEF domain-containing protein n=1 Tax=Jeotgalibacillus sp. JSM ZJ347 TaxID=3342117 RepID=UPI0035A9A78F